MKKLIALIMLVGVFVWTMPALAAKPSTPPGQDEKEVCATIKDGTISDKFGDVIGLGYNELGYNYQAHMFNGMYCDAYNDVSWCQQFKDVSLMMKWNDAWLSNKDCGTQNGQADYPSLITPDGILDRHYPTDTYIGSGAWLTNHATGTYTSSTQYSWDISGDWVVAVNGGVYNHDYTFVMTSLPDGTFTGVGGYPAGADDYTFDEVVINGQITADAISFTAVYYINGVPTGYSWTATGTIDAFGQMSGTGTSGVSTWASTFGEADKIYKTCEVSDFVKIVAAPADAEMFGENWVAANGTEIGPAIWGSFAIIQEIANDPCGEYEVMNYMSPLRKGLGNW